VKTRTAFLSILFLVIFGCAGDSREVFREITPKSPTLTLFVGSSQNHQLLPGVEVILVSSEGQNVMGKTDRSGSLSIDPKLLLKPGAAALLFCSERFFCGAIRIDSDLLEYSEKYIELAPFSMR
jgi:hypothetical protein